MKYRSSGYEISRLKAARCVGCDGLCQVRRRCCEGSIDAKNFQVSQVLGFGRVALEIAGNALTVADPSQW